MSKVTHPGSADLAEILGLGTLDIKYQIGRLRRDRRKRHMAGKATESARGIRQSQAVWKRNPFTAGDGVKVNERYKGEHKPLVIDLTKSLLLVYFGFAKK